VNLYKKIGFIYKLKRFFFLIDHVEL